MKRICLGFSYVDRDLVNFNYWCTRSYLLQSWSLLSGLYS